MKCKNIVFVGVIFAVLLTLSPCQAQESLIGWAIRESVNAVGGAVIDKLTEPSVDKYQFGKYEVRFYEGKNLKNKASYLFAVYDDDKLVRRVSFEKDLPEDMKKIDDFKQMTEIKKKVFIKNVFRDIYNFDLGPVEFYKYPVGKYEVMVYEGSRENQSGYLFDACDENNKKVAGLFYSKKDDISMKAYNSFMDMKTLDEKKQYLQERFLKYAKFDLGYVAPPVKQAGPQPTMATTAELEKKTSSPAPEDQKK
jgi:hypothetical protein